QRRVHDFIWLVSRIRCSYGGKGGDRFLIVAQLFRFLSELFRCGVGRRSGDRWEQAIKRTKHWEVQALRRHRKFVVRIIEEEVHGEFRSRAKFEFRPPANADASV